MKGTLNIAIRVLIFLLLHFPETTIKAQPANTVRGRVTDSRNRPLAFCTIKLMQTDALFNTGADGSFAIPVTKNLSEINLEFSYVGKQTLTRTIKAAAFNQLHFFVLVDLSLRLDNVEVTGVRKGNVSNSSIMFNREAIAQMQAFSLADVLNNLPGKTTVPPQLQNPQLITLRSEADGNHALTNSLGTAIIVDGIRQSNDANMQNRSFSIRGMSGSVINSRSDGSFDVPFSGPDLRDIPVNNIESIEVVSGVASAQYSELTSGAIIINRQAGKTNYQFNTRINEGSTEFSLSKGIGLGKKWGALNITLGYLKSNKDPRDKLKKFDRVNTALMWTYQIAKGLKNTLSLDYSTQLDDVLTDPDDDAELKTYSRRRNFSVSNRLLLSLPASFVRSATFSVSYSSGYQETYNQWLLNGPPKGLANKDTTGIYEGIFLPGAYLAEERIIGRPKSVSANLSFSSLIKTGTVLQNLSYGVNFSLTGNKGEGIVVNPDRPRWISVNNQNERPFNYRLLKDLVNTGFYLQDNLITKLKGHTLNIGLGLRYDFQNGFGNLQPRINARYQLSKEWELNMAYGISTKSPTMAHRYPAPTYLDIPLLNLYNGYADQSLFLVYTQKVNTDNSNLKPARSNQFETGLRYNGSWGTASLFGYIKRDRNGFNSYSQFQPLLLPNFGYTVVPGQKITYYPTGDSTIFAGAGNYIITNGLSSDNYGSELLIQTNRIKPLMTRFTLSAAFSWSKSDNSNDRRIIMVDNSYIQQGGKAWYGVYQADVRENVSLMSRIGSDTHIPKLGFIISLSADIHWLRSSKTIPHGNEPVGYIDKNFQFHTIGKFDSNNPEYGYLKLDPNVTLVDGAAVMSTEPVNLPFVYGNLNMRIAKEVNRQIRLTLNAYNVLNIRPEYYNTITQTSVVYNNPLSLSAGLSIQF